MFCPNNQQCCQNRIRKEKNEQPSCPSTSHFRKRTTGYEKEEEQHFHQLYSHGCLGEESDKKETKNGTSIYYMATNLIFKDKQPWKGKKRKSTFTDQLPTLKLTATLKSCSSNVNFKLAFGKVSLKRIHGIWLFY